MADYKDTDTNSSRLFEKGMEEAVLGDENAITNVYSNENENENENDVEAQRGQKEQPPLSRTGSQMTVPGFFSNHMADVRMKAFKSFLKNWLFLCAGIFTVFSIYWGVLYDRPKRFKNVSILLVNEDAATNGIPPLIGQTLQEIAQSDSMKQYGKYTVYNSTSFASKFDTTNTTQKINELVHHQKYWAVYHVKPGTTYALYTAMKNADSGFNINKNASVGVEFVYETARDLLAMNSTILPIAQILRNAFSPQVVASSVYGPLVKMLSSTEKTTLLNNAPALLSNVASVQSRDLIPVTNTTLMAPMQVGMIFLIILTFFQFNTFASVHMMFVKIKKGHLVMYRLVSSFLSYFIMSLAYSLVSRAFQIDFTVTFGKSGFLVFWMTSFLTMSAVGGANENMALFIIPVFPPLLGFWLMFWVLSNVSPTFFPLVVAHPFYRYGYAFPVHNASDIYKVILTNSYKGHIGRNYGILIAWVVVNSLVFPLALRFFGTRMAKKAGKP